VISVVTVVRNDLEGLQRTYQSLPPITDEAAHEWIVVDGASDDGAPRWLSDLKDPRLIFRSEPDDGLYDAMNIGVSQASGQYVLFLNAGDQLVEASTLHRIDEQIEPRTDLAYGHAIEVDARGRERIRPARSPAWITHGMFTHHQAMLFRRSRLLESGYRTIFELSADYDLIARWMMSGAVTQNLHMPIARYSLGGRSDRGRRKGIREDSTIRRHVLGMSQFEVQRLAVAHLAHLAAKRTVPRLMSLWRSSRRS
jgi:putative colanic acid biosynthesis glycosyltransferase